MQKTATAAAVHITAFDQGIADMAALIRASDTLKATATLAGEINAIA